LLIRTGEAVKILRERRKSMEGQKRPRVFLQKRYNTQKRFLALMLAFAMIFTSVGTDLNVAYAAEGNRVDFEIYGADLVEAINDAVETQSPVTADDLNFTNGAIEKFDALFFGEGKVYEVFPPVEGGDMDAEVRVFVRLPEDADDMYMVTGDEEVIFLYINNGEDTISCSTKIIRTVDGEEKVKSTKRITVKSYEDKFGEEESNIISKPEETLPAVPETSAPESQPEETPAETLNSAETTAPEETTIPEETEAPDATEESSETEETTEAPESTEAQETETSEETKEEVTEAETEATEAEKEETEAVEETEEPETETDEKKSQDDSAVTLSSISRHQVPVVAVKEDAELIETEAEETEKETTAAPEKETTTAEETTSKETTAAPEESTEATEETSTEAESSEEATESEEATTAPETQETEDTTEAETEVPAETETTAPAETETQAPVQSATPAEPEEGNKPAATDTDLVGMGWCSTAKAYTTTLKALKLTPDMFTKGTYRVSVAHILEDGDRIYAKEKILTFREEDFVDGLLDLEAYEYEKEGMELQEAAMPVLTADDFQETEEYYECAVEVYYQVSEGYHIVERVEEDSESQNIDTFSAIYVGDLDDIDIVPDEKKLIVKVNFLDKASGTPLMQPHAFEVTADEENKFPVEYELPVIDGYTPWVAPDSDFVIEDNVLKNVNEITEAGKIIVDVLYEAGDVEYTVNHMIQDLNDPEKYDLRETQTLTGKVNGLTDAQPLPIDGFTPQEIIQQKISEGVVVEVKYDRNEYTLLYDTTGGSYVPSVTAKYEAEITLANGNDVPKREGYTFDGWYLDADLKEKADSTLHLTEDQTVYAKWKGTLVGYKAVYLTENADDDNYSYAGTVDLRDISGTTVQADGGTQKPQGFDTEHFIFKESTSEVVAADGSTVIVVKYTRKQYTITFLGTSSNGGNKLICGLKEHNHKEPSEGYIGWDAGCYEKICGKLELFGHKHTRNCFGTELVCGLEEHRHQSDCYEYVPAHGNLTITAKYEQFIGDQWNALVGSGTEYKNWSWIWEDGHWTSYQSHMPGEPKTLSPKKYNSKDLALKYYIEDSQGKIEYKNRKFLELTTTYVQDEGTYPTFDEEFFEIDGYKRFASTVREWRNGTDSGKRAYWSGENPEKFYYIKANYELELINGDQSNTKIVPYKNDITQYLEEPEYNPYGDGTFEGWYLDPEFTEAYDSDYTMPKGLVLYAKWNPVSYEVKFVDSEDVNTVYDTQNVVRNGKVEAFIPEKPGYIFKGWYTDQKCQSAFDYAAQITENRTIYAKWQQSTTTTYTVKHQTADGTLIEEEAPRSGKVGATVIAEAITPAGAYAGYVPDAISKTHTLKADSSENVIVFTYTKEGELNYKVQYKYNEQIIVEDGSFTSEAHTIKVNVNLKKILPLGYKIENDQTFQNVELTAGENIVVFNLVPAEYKITYQLNGGTETTNPSTYKPIEIPESGLKLNNPVKDGYKFTGWELVVGEAIKGEHDPLNTVILPGSYGNLTFEANWERNEAALTIEYVDDSAEPKTLKDAYKDTVIIGDPYDVKDAIDASIEYDGHNYTWLKTDGEVEGTVEGDISITAVYTLDDNGNTIPDKDETPYNITYAAGEHGIGAETVVTENQMPDLPVTSLPTVSEDGKSVMFDGAAIITAENGYKFGDMTVSWNPEESGRFVEYEPKNGSAVTSIMAKNIGEELSNVTNITVTVNFVKDDAAVNQLSYTVEHIYDDATEAFSTETVTQDVWVNDPQVLQVKDITVQSEDAEYTYDSNSYDLAVITDPADPSIVTGLTGSGTIENGGKIQVVYSKDENGDHVPDKYQTEVYFKVVNGSWNDETNTQKVQTVTLMTGGTWDDNGSYTVTEDIVPGVGDKANEGYKAGDWDRTPIDAIITKTTSAEERTFTYTYTEDKTQTKEISYTVKHICRDTGEQIGETEKVTELVWINSADTTLNVKDITLRSKDGYAYDGNSMDLERSEKTLLSGRKTIQNGETITVYYDVDVIGPDEIPDKYQVEVVFTAVNGTVDGQPQIEKVFNLKKGDEYAEDGSYELTAEDVPEALAAAGYEQSTLEWDVNPEGAVIDKKEDTKVTFIVRFKEAAQKYTVQYIDEDTNEGLKDQVVKDAKYGTYITGANEAIDIKDYVFTRATDLTVSENNESNYVFVYYSKDANGDKVPDKYQRIVTFNVVNGAWNDGETAQKETWVTLTDEAGNWSEDGSHTLVHEDIPAAGEKPDTGYKAGIWKAHPENQVITRDSDNVEYTYSYVPDETQTKELTYDVKHVRVSEDGTEEVFAMETVPQRIWVNTFPEDLNVWDITLRNGDGWIYDRNENPGGTVDPLKEDADRGYLVGEGTVLNGREIIVYYVKDENGDNIPDKYQRKVTFNVVNGAWNDGETAQKETWVTLTDEAGNWSEDGSHTLVHEDIPAAGEKPDTGYKAGIWKAHPENQVITRDSDNVEYTYSYVPDETQTKELTYDVKHVRVSEDGTEEVFSMETVPQRIWINTFPEDLNVWDITLRNGDGWTYDWNENHGGTVDPLKTDADREYLVGEGTVLNGSEIIVYYVKDENGDNIPDKYQRTVTFNVVNGAWNDGETAQKEIWVTLTDAEGNWAEDGSYTLTADDIPAAGEKPDTGYRAGIWTAHPENQVITRDSDNVEYTYSYVPDETQTKELSYTVNHIKINSDGTESLIDSEKVPENVWVNSDQSDLAVQDIILKEEAGYAYERNVAPEGASLKLDASLTKLTGEGRIADKGVVNVYYTEDGNDDDIPDKHQIIFTYVSAGNGTVEGKTTEVYTFMDDKKENYIEPTEVKPEANVTITPAEGYAFDFWDDTEGNDFTPNMEHLKQKTYGTDTTFTVHFDKDEIGTDPTDPNKPDNVPDNRQITFRYVSENPSYGTVSGTVVEVRTIMEVVEGEKGYQVLETKSVNPFAEVTVSANGRYRFERWSDGTTNFANADEISAASYSADAVFTAYFNYYSGGGSGGGGGGNGGGPSGSGGDSSRGPGVTVTIENPDVPLAPAPETGTGDVISINDGMVPMAPLPKTGQTTMRSTLLMAFSGILLAITGFSKKRKEEEN
jgi:uncharacterized repeat protein (TIGR02543 family)/LPXTG-motif cell wall-anchored protein